MSVNVGNLDRILRVVLGVVLFYLAFFSGIPAFAGAFLKYGAALVGVIMLVTGFMRVCPLYSIFGINTCRR